MGEDSICSAMAERLAANGKEKMEIIGAIMHTLATPMKCSESLLRFQLRRS
jgi:hypothetical protein